MASFPQVGVKIKNIWNHQQENHSQNKILWEQPVPPKQFFAPILSVYQSDERLGIVILARGNSTHQTC